VGFFVISPYPWKFFVPAITMLSCFSGHSTFHLRIAIEPALRYRRGTLLPHTAILLNLENIHREPRRIELRCHGEPRRTTTTLSIPPKRNQCPAARQLPSCFFLIPIFFGKEGMIGACDNLGWLKPKTGSLRGALRRKHEVENANPSAQHHPNPINVRAEVDNADSSKQPILNWVLFSSIPKK